MMIVGTEGQIQEDCVYVSFYGPEFWRHVSCSAHVGGHIHFGILSVFLSGDACTHEHLVSAGKVSTPAPVVCVEFHLGKSEVA